MNSIPIYTDFVDTEKLPAQPLITQVYLAGSKVSFKCSCGCNVFLKFGNKYHCNACTSIFIGE
jgi:hypothetical protein